MVRIVHGPSRQLAWLVRAFQNMMASVDSDDDGDSSPGSESDIDMNDSMSDRSFESSDSGDDEDAPVEDTAPELSQLDSQASNPAEDGFWDDTGVHNSPIPQFREETGPTHNLTAESSALDYFHLICPPTFFEKIAEETNRYAVQKNGESPDENWQDTTPEEIRAYIGVLIMMGVNQLPELSMYWSENIFLGT